MWPRRDLIDLHHQDRARGRRATCSRPTDGLALFDCGPSTCIAALKAGLAGRGLGLDGRPPPAALAHPPRPRGRRRIARPRAPGPARPRLRDRRAPPGRPEPPRTQRPPPLRRRLRRRSGASSRRCRRRTSRSSATGCSASSASRPPATPPTTSATCTRTGRSTPATRPASAIQPGRHVLPVSPPPDVDVEAWFRTFEEIERRRPERLALIHFGVAESPSEHLALVREELATWAERGERMDEERVGRRRPPRPRARGRRGRGRASGSGPPRSGSRTPG